jgi:DNA-binding protein H-NS
MPLSFNLAEMSLKELKKLERDVAAAIEGFDARSKAAAISELEAYARQLGFSLAELTGVEISSKRQRTPAVAKYRNPEDHADTWSGRGRKPRWFEAALKAGTKVSDLMV